MEFNFDIKGFFPDEITKIGSRLVPEGFAGDRRAIQDCITKMSLVLTVLGEHSAKAQGLQKVITSGERLRNTDQTVFVLVDPEEGSRSQGAILGMLKVGLKHLYVFDSRGNHHEITACCVLDFYVHESKQRMGLGKKLFEYMLKEENIKPQHLAIDKPSPKFLSFLSKHYGLTTTIPQMNNFVLFEGFFVNRPEGENKSYPTIAAGKSSNIPINVRAQGNFMPIPSPVQPKEPPQQDVVHSPRYGRQPPHKPVSTMGLILQHTPPTSQQPSQANSVIADSEAPAEEIANIAEVEEEPEPEEEEEPEDEEPGEAVEEEVEVVKAPEEVDAARNVESPAPTCHVQAAPKHLDLKFYHSSLW